MDAINAVITLPLSACAVFHFVSIFRNQHTNIRRMHDETTRDHGIQPIDALLCDWGLDNHQLVAGCGEQMTHKQVQRARKGRRLTLHSMQKLTRALNESVLQLLDKEQQSVFVPYLHRHLFNYAKGYSPDWQDPNSALKPVKS